MSIPFSVQAPAMVQSVRIEETRGPSQVARGRVEPRDYRGAFALACHDVVNEVRLRMARRGYQWE